MHKIFQKIRKPAARRQSCVDSISNFLAFQGSNEQPEMKNLSSKKQKEDSSKDFLKPAKQEPRRFTITGEIQRENSDSKEIDIKQIKQDLLESKNDGKAYKQFKKLLSEKKKKLLESQGYTVITKKSQTSEKKKKKKSKNKIRKSAVMDTQIQSLLSKPSNIEKYLMLYQKEKNVEIDETIKDIAKQIQEEAQKFMQGSSETDVKKSEEENQKALENFLQDSNKYQKVAKSKYGFRRDLGKIQEQDENEPDSAIFKQAMLLPSIVINVKEPVIEKEKNQVEQAQQTKIEKKLENMNGKSNQSTEQMDQNKEKPVQKQVFDNQLLTVKNQEQDKLMKIQSPKKEKKRKSQNLKESELKLNQKEESSSQIVKSEKEAKKENEEQKKNVADQQKELPQGEQSQTQEEQQQSQNNQEKKSEEKTIYDILQEQFDQFQKEKEDKKKLKKKKKKKKKSEDNSFSSTSSDDIIEEEELQRLIQNRRKAIFGELA